MFVQGKDTVLPRGYVRAVHSQKLIEINEKIMQTALTMQLLCSAKIGPPQLTKIQCMTSSL